MKKQKMVQFQTLFLFLTCVSMTFLHFKKTIFATFICAVLSGTLVGCSDDFDPMDKSKIEPVEKDDKAEFQRKFAEQCVKREEKAAKGQVSDTGALEKNCVCVAEELAKNLTSQEAEKFLDDDENPESLVIKYDAAAYHCIQEKQPKSPDLFKK
jgi:hypothetical protein